MAKGVIDPLEMIYVKHDERQRYGVPLTANDLAGRTLEERTATGTTNFTSISAFPRMPLPNHKVF